MTPEIPKHRLVEKIRRIMGHWETKVNIQKHVEFIFDNLTAKVEDSFSLSMHDLHIHVLELKLL
jgi:hypothetical protein